MRNPASEQLGCIELLILAALVVIGFVLTLWGDYVIQGFKALK